MVKSLFDLCNWKCIPSEQEKAKALPSYRVLNGHLSDFKCTLSMRVWSSLESIRSLK